MKKLIFTIIVLALSFSVIYAQNDPVLVKVNDREITKSEFLQIYLKNNNNPSYDKASLDEYMELFKKFKLKVAEAEALGYDTIPEIQKELEGYRKQLSRPYLVDSAKNMELVKEAYERTKYEINASHILVRVAENAPSADTLKAYNKIMDIKKRIQDGQDFEVVAKSKNGSEDPSVMDNGGNLGYFTAFQMVYPFESIAYSTPVGSIGGPIRTKYGYHIVKVNDKRPARGTITTAHIMIVSRANDRQSEIAKAEAKINEIYEKLEAGEDFSKLVRLYSEDQSTVKKGGVLPAFGSGTTQRMIPEFEDAAFDLENDGDYSEPFKTDYGFHIVKRIEYKPLGSYEELKGSLQEKVNRGERGQKTQNSFIAKLKNENKFKDKSKKHLDWFVENVDSSIFKGKWNSPELKGDKMLFKYEGKKYGTQEFKSYLKENQRGRAAMPIDQFVMKSYKEWQNSMILADEESKLKEKYPEFRALINEYHDGVLLYEVMKNMVWDKAIKDTAGLKAYFNNNIDKYMWPERVKADIYKTNEKSIADNVFELLKSSDSISSDELMKQINSDSELNLTFKTGAFAKNDTDFLNGTNTKIGINEPYNFEDKFYVLNVHEELPESNKTLKEARGAVIQDYQNHLEKEWLDELRSKHSISIKDDVLYSLGD